MGAELVAPDEAKLLDILLVDLLQGLKRCSS